MTILKTQQEDAEARWREAWLAGPRRTRWEAVPLQVGDAAPDLELPDATGAPRRLSDLWSGGPLHLVFLRHFGCSCLAERWESLRDELPAYAAQGATTVAVCQAEPERAAAVASRRGYPFTLLCDPDRGAYEAFGLLEGTAPQVLHDFAWTLNDAATGDDWLAGRRDSERALVDNPWQLPGEFVIAPGGRIVLAHRAQFCEDFPARGVVLGAIAAAGGAA